MVLFMFFCETRHNRTNGTASCNTVVFIHKIRTSSQKCSTLKKKILSMCVVCTHVYRLTIVLDTLRAWSGAETGSRDYYRNDCAQLARRNGRVKMCSYRLHTCTQTREKFNKNNFLTKDSGFC